MEDRKRKTPLCVKHGCAGIGKSYFSAIARSSVFIIKKTERVAEKTISQEVK